MKKENKKVLFSRNRISLTSEDTISQDAYVCSDIGLPNSLSSDDGRYEKRTKTIRKKVTRKCESPLGFYYFKDEFIEKEVDEPVDNSHVYIYEIYLVSKHHIYKLIIPRCQGSIRISVDTRPWNIVSGYKSLSDNLIQDLFNILESIFFELQNDKAYVAFKNNNKLEKSSERLGQFKNKLYLSIFGNSKGPIQQTNSEKILSHGFDLKTSFRKDKEK